jgi:hypothetical protein
MSPPLVSTDSDAARTGHQGGGVHRTRLRFRDRIAWSSQDLVDKRRPFTVARQPGKNGCEIVSRWRRPPEDRDEVVQEHSFMPPGDHFVHHARSREKPLAPTETVPERTVLGVRDRTGAPNVDQNRTGAKVKRLGVFMAARIACRRYCSSVRISS